MTQDQELAKLLRYLAGAKRKARRYENRVMVLTNNQRGKERRERTRRLIEHGAILESAELSNICDCRHSRKERIK